VERNDVRDVTGKCREHDTPAIGQPYILALADDMTGALETGCKFSAAGIRTIVSAKPMTAGSVPAIVFDTETRHCSPQRASQEISRFIRESGASRPQLVYKKTDSTLRGNISAELQALAQLYPEWRIAYAPAYPALGRTVKLGVLYVDGIAVAETSFGNDVLNPIRSSSVSAVLHPELSCTIFDGETDEHLADAARTILSDRSMRIAAGPAVLAEMIAGKISLQRSAPPRLPVVRTCLVINGSLHERSAMQMRHADGPGWRVVQKDHPAGVNAVDVARENARYVVRQIAEIAPQAVFVIGGDTAFAVVQELGLPLLVPIAEAVPGVPVTRIEAAHLGRILPGRKQDLYLITKAGGFGEPDVLSRVHARLTG
jgi:D-threonate/D-erythronate kinase